MSASQEESGQKIVALEETKTNPGEDNIERSKFDDDSKSVVKSVLARLCSQEVELQEQAKSIDYISRELLQLEKQQQKLAFMHREAQICGPGVYDSEVYSVVQPDEHMATLRWRIACFSKLKVKEVSSDRFRVGGTDWILRTSAPDADLQFYLRVDPLSLVTYPRKWRAYVQMVFGLINQTNEKKSVWRYTTHTFQQEPISVSWGFQSFLALKDFMEPEEGFVLDDSVVLEITINTAPQP